MAEARRRRRPSLFATTAEYQFAVDYVADYRVISCATCGDPFEVQRRRGMVPKTCSDFCAAERKRQRARRKPP